MNFAGKDILFVDFETYYDSKVNYRIKSREYPRGLPIAVYIRDERFKVHGLAYCWALEGVSHWISGEHTIAGWRDSIDWANTVVISHNVKFDGSILAWRYAVKPYAWFDTVALAKAVLGYNVASYGLKNLAEFLGLQAKGELKGDGIRNLTPQQEQDMAAYCKGDVDICKGIYEKLIPQFPQSQLWHVDWTLRAFTEPILQLAADVLTSGVRKEKERREAAIKASGIEKAVLSSNKQFAELLARRGISVPTKQSKTGREIPAFAKTDAGLAQLEKTHPCLYAARLASKANLLETRGAALLEVSKGGSFPFDVGFSGAVQTHRYSGGSGGGGNPQNFTRKSFLREAVTAPMGSKLVVGDFAAIELRILAWLANEPKLISRLINDEDVYAAFASEIYKRPIAPRIASPERAFGKEAVLGLGYGMGFAKFKDRVRTVLRQEITDTKSRETVSLYRSTYAAVPRLWEACSGLIPLIADGRIQSLYFAPFIKARKNALVLPSGLPIQYPNLRRLNDEWVYDVYEKRYEPEAVKLWGGTIVENICQGLAGELCKEAIYRAEVEYGLSCKGQIHDEIIAVSKTPEEDCLKLEKLMQVSPKWFPQLRLKSEVHSGQNWNAAK